MIIGVGCDIVETARFKDNDRVARRVLSNKEYEYYESCNDYRKTEYLAGRFAAKEAIIKAYPKEIVLSDIEVLQNDNKKLICNLRDFHIHISISHEREYAIAYAICEEF